MPTSPEPTPASVVDRIGPTLFYKAPVAYSILDPASRQLDASDHFYRLFGHPPGTAGLSALEMTHPDDRARTEEYLGKLVRGDIERVRLEKRYLRADGTTFWGELVAERVVKPSGKEVLLGVITDISERHALEVELRSIADERLTFVGQVNHELRNPLSTIVGLAELLVTSDLAPEHREQAQVILGEATEAIRLVADLVELSRSGAGSFAVVSEPFPLDQVLDRVAHHAAQMQLAQRRSLGVEMAVADDVEPCLRGDPHRLTQILDNLVGNAVKFTTEGTIRLEVGRLDTRTLEFRIHDTGPGIPKERTDDIFQTFRRLPSTASGAGLGLGIARQLAETMGGTLHLEATGPGGSTFLLTLPLSPDSTDPRPSPVDPPVLTADGQHRVLVVEDSVEGQLVIRSQLERLGYRYEIVGDGPQALSALQRATFSVALVDWHLPGMDGLELVGRIRAREEADGRPRMPIISLTARNMPADIQACRSAGADEHLPKPASLTDLGRALGRWADRRRAERSTTADTRSSPRPARPLDGATLPEGRPPDGPEVVNPGALDRLLADVDDPATASQILEVFLRQLPERLVDIQTAWTIGPDPLASAAHSLRGTSLIVGATALADIAAVMETSARGGAVGPPGSLERLAAAADATIEALHNHVDPRGD